MSKLASGRLLSTVAILALLCTPVLAQQKIGFVNTIQILGESEEGKARIAAWDASYKSQMAEVEAEGAELQNLRQQFAQQQLSLNPETQAEMQRSIEEKTTKLQRMQEDINRKAQQDRDKIVQEMSRKMQKILDDYGQQNGFAVIFLRSEQQVFVADALDVTQEILRIYNEQHPVASTGSGGR